MGFGRSDSRPETENAAELGSPAFRRVVEALLEGQPAPPEDQAALTDAERAEVAALARTAHLTRVTLQMETPDEAAERASLDRARTQLSAQPAGVPLPAPPSRRGSFGAWVRRLLGMNEEEE